MPMQMALIGVSVAINAALNAWALRNELPSPVRDRVEVTFGIFDLTTHQVWSPPAAGTSKLSLTLATPPSDRGTLDGLETRLGGRERVRTQRDSFRGLSYFQYDPAFRVVGIIESDLVGIDVTLALPEDGPVRLGSVARVRFELPNTSARLNLYWVHGYGGGIFLPFETPLRET